VDTKQKEKKQKVCAPNFIVFGRGQFSSYCMSKAVLIPVPDLELPLQLDMVPVPHIIFWYAALRNRKTN
jgi:hypothetical protein